LHVVAIIAAYNEEDIIGQVMRALIDEGVSVYLIDNRSTDGTVAAAEPFLGRGVIGIEQFPKDSDAGEGDAGFAWEQILKRKETLSRELDADWFIHHDADEFRESPWSGMTLTEAIRRVDVAGFNAIDFHLLDFRPTENTAWPVADVRDAFQFYEPGRAWDHRQIKCWKNTGGVVDLVSSGGHDAQFSGRRVFPIRFLLRHYPIRSQAHGERKVFRERRGRFAPGELARGWHVQYSDVRQGDSFVPDSASLVQFDPDSVRMDLMIRHRDVEDLHGELARLRPVAAKQLTDLERLRQHLETQDEVLERLRRLVTTQDAQLQELSRHLHAQDEELARLRPSVSSQDAQLQELGRHLRHQDEELGRLRPLVSTQDTQLQELRRHLRDQDEELARQRPLVSTQDTQLQELGRHLRAQDEELARLRPLVSTQDTQLQELGRHLRDQDDELARLRLLVSTQDTQLQELIRHLRTQDDEVARLRSVVSDQHTQLEELRPHLKGQDDELAQLRPVVSAQEAQLEELRLHLKAQDDELARLRPLAGRQQRRDRAPNAGSREDKACEQAS